MGWKINLLIIAFALVLFVFLINNNNEKLGLSGDLIEKFDLERSSEGEKIVFSGEKEQGILKIKKFERFDLSKAENYISENNFIINSLYREVSSAYPGEISNRIVCSDEFRPVEVENSQFNYSILYATERFTYGACSWDLIRYRSILYYQHCNDDFYEIKFFFDYHENSTKYEEMLISIECGDRG